MENQFFHSSIKEEGISLFEVDHPLINALNFNQFKILLESLFKRTEDPRVKVIVLTGRGKTFMAGFDIKEIQNINTPEACFEKTMEVKKLFLKLEYLHKPVIAAINGDCLGGGLEVALACHLRFANQGARFGFPEINIATIPTFGGTQRSARLVGKAKAMELLLTGELIGSKKALQIGLINGIFPDETFREDVLKIAKKVAQKSLPAIQGVLESVIHGVDKNLDEAMAWESQVSSKLILTEDLKEGIAAFFERRKPVFKNR